MNLRKFILNICFGCIFLAPISGSIFYIDPTNGSIDNDGSFDAPWNTLEAVFTNNLVESYAYSLPYDVDDSSLNIKNQGAPIKSGDTLLLRDGLHGTIFLRNYNNTLPITIQAAEGHRPILESIRLQACKNWNIDGLTISSEPYDNYINYRLIYLDTHGFQGPTSHINISNCEIYSTNTPWELAEDWIDKSSGGIYIHGDSIEIINNLIRNVDMGITAKGDYIKVIGNEVNNFSGDGLRILGSFGLYEKNTIKNCYNVDENHDDGIQSFTTNGLVVDNNIVRSNIIINNEDPNQILAGPLQGIGCFDGFYNNWIVENNLIIVNHWHGITFLGANNCKIINNTVIDPTPDITPGPSWIRIDDHKDGTPSMNCLAKNNVANNFVVDGELGNNVTLTDYMDYADNFEDYSNNDFHLIEGSLLIDAADNSIAPAYDLENISRPQGNSADIGCYEYEVAVDQIELTSTPIVVFPNPFYNTFNIDGPAGLYNIELLDAKGKLVKSINTDIDLITIECSALPSGLYFLKFLDDHHSIFTKKMIKL